MIESWLGRIQITSSLTHDRWETAATSLLTFISTEHVSKPILSRPKISNAFYIHTAQGKVLQWESEHGPKLQEEGPDSRSETSSSERWWFPKPPPQLPPQRTLSCAAQPGQDPTDSNRDATLATCTQILPELLMEISLQKREVQSWLNLMIPEELQDDQQREGQ